MIMMTIYTMSIIALTLLVDHVIAYLIKLYKKRNRKPSLMSTLSASVDPAFKQRVQEAIDRIQPYKEKYTLKRFVQRAVYNEVVRCEYAYENWDMFGMYLKHIDAEEADCKQYIKRAEQSYRSDEVLRQREMDRGYINKQEV